MKEWFKKNWLFLLIGLVVIVFLFKSNIFTRSSSSSSAPSSSLVAAAPSGGGLLSSGGGFFGSLANNPLINPLAIFGHR